MGLGGVGWGWVGLGGVRVRVGKRKQCCSSQKRKGGHVPASTTGALPLMRFLSSGPPSLGFWFPSRSSPSVHSQHPEFPAEHQPDHLGADVCPPSIWEDYKS